MGGNPSRLSPRRAGARWLIALLAAGAVAGSGLLSACEPGRGQGPPTTAPETLAWREVALPDDVQPRTLTAAGSDLVIGGQVGTPSAPRLLVLHGTDLTHVPLEPKSPYARVAQWLSIAVRGGRLEAVGGARGGAHANYRWTVWTGTWSGAGARVVEQPQPFGVFGGWGAGDLTGIAFAGSEPVIAGAWQSDRTGNDVSLWRRTADRWRRLSSTGLPLGSTPEALNGARFVTTTGEGLALAGSVTELGGGRVASVPALWTTAGIDGPWRLTKLPARDPLAEAHAARCGADDCVVVGADSGRLAVWDVHDGQARRATPPSTAVAADEAVPAPVTLDGSDVIAVTGSLLERTDSGWVARSAPEGRPTALAAVAERLYAITVAGGRARLWVSQP